MWLMDGMPRDAETGNALCLCCHCASTDDGKPTPQGVVLRELRAVRRDILRRAHEAKRERLLREARHGTKAADKDD
jgi:hypothetical protein